MPENIIKKDSLSQWKQDIVLYSIETNRKRSIADAKDGLKRVQRRTLDSMYNHLPCSTKLVKTAEVVGNVIGRSHPHGNCLRGNTKVYISSSDHIATIETLYRDNLALFSGIGVNEETLEPELIHVHDLRIGQYTDKIYHIETEHGELECTDNHPIMVSGGYKEAKDIEVGDLLYSYNKKSNEVSSLKVINVYIEEVDQEPMYDFTVDTTHNMLIPLKDDEFICVHNSSVEDAIKPMSNWFEIKMPLIYSESNMGSMQGDGAAAARYTEIMLSEFAKECVIADMKDSKDIVDWSLTYNNRSKEPDYFPAAVPLLLINGTFGLGTGMMAEVPKHNLVEVIDATLNLIKNPKAPVVLIPDHCMACEIIDTNWKSICNKGKGNYVVRGVIDIEYKKDEPRLVIKSVPDRVFFDKGDAQNGGVKYAILNMVKEGKLPNIIDIEEHSHGNDMRIVIRLKKGSDPNYTRDLLYKTTQLQNTYTVNFEVLDGYKPMRMSYKSYLEFFIEQRKITKFRLYCAQLQKFSTRFHERDAYVKVLESGEIDNIIKMIKNQTNPDDTYLIEYLVKKVKITDLQAKFIINSNIKALSKAYLKKYKEDLKVCTEMITFYENKITHDELIVQDIVEELEHIKKKYGEPRKCKVISKNDVTNIPKGDFKIVITENNYIKKLSPNDYVGAYRGDNPKFIINVENTENLLLFSTQGKVFKLPVHKIPMSEKNSVGFDIRILLKGLTSDIISVIYEPHLKMASKKFGKDYLVVVTLNNCIKKLELDDFLTVPPSGIIYTKLNSGDYVKEVAVIPDMFDIILYSDRRALRVPMKEIPAYRRSTLGVSAMNLKDGETIDGLSVILPEATDVVVITESGKINKFNIAGLPVSARYKAGNSVIRLSKTDKIHSIYGVNDNDIINIVTKNTNVDIPVKDITGGSSVSAGIKALPMKNDCLVKTVIKHS